MKQLNKAQRVLFLCIAINVALASEQAPSVASLNDNVAAAAPSTAAAAAPSPSPPTSSTLLLPTLHAAAYLRVARDRLLHRTADEDSAWADRQAKMCGSAPKWLRGACAGAASAAQSAERVVLKSGAGWLQTLEARLNERLLKALSGGDGDSCATLMDLARRVVGAASKVDGDDDDAGQPQVHKEQQQDAATAATSLGGDSNSNNTTDEGSALAAQLLPGDVIGGISLSKLAALGSNSSATAFNNYWPLPAASAAAANNNTKVTALGACAAKLAAALPKEHRLQQQDDAIGNSTQAAAAAAAAEAEAVLNAEADSPLLLLTRDNNARSSSSPRRMLVMRV